MTRTMQSVVYSELGDPSVLRLVARKLREPEADEVRVRVVVSSINPSDLKSRRGEGLFSPRMTHDVVPNHDGAGVIDAVGADVTGLSVGDRVWMILAAMRGDDTGTAQQYTTLPATAVARLPAGVSYDVGACLGAPAITAHRALTVGHDPSIPLSPGALRGKRVLVAGGAGAVGHATIQLARWAGAEVISSVSSPIKAELAYAAGSNCVVNYNETGASDIVRGFAPHGIDTVVEVSPTRNASLNADVLKSSGTIAIYASDGEGTWPLDIGRSMGLNAHLHFILLYTLPEAAMARAVRDIQIAAAEGVLPVGRTHGLPLSRFTLEQMAQAHEAAEAGTIGKVIVDIAG